MAVAVEQGHGFKPFGRPPRCKRQSFTQLDYKMLDFSQSQLILSSENAFQFNNIHKSFSTPCLSRSSRSEDDSENNSRIEIIIGHTAPRIRALVAEVAIALASGVNPDPASSGLGGAYFLRARNGDTIAVAKPIDEEPLAFNNPKGFAGRTFGQPGMKHSIRIGETGLRESAAYLLDHEGFSGVPPTGLVKFSRVKFNLNSSASDSTPHYKIASLQRFVNHDSDAGDLGPSSFSVTSVHHIGILDVRLMNLDRHAGNILVRGAQENYTNENVELVPIDHGFCLPESLDDPYFEWLHWPQAVIPFSESEVDYISNLDPYRDAQLLRNELPSLRESSIRVLILCTIFLKQATAYGLCLSDIGGMMTREFHGGEENLSVLEKLCINAKTSLKNGHSDDDNLNSDLNEEVVEVFPFDDECGQISDSPYILKNSPTKVTPLKIPRYSLVDVMFPSTKNGNGITEGHDSITIVDNCANEDDNGDDNSKIGRLLRSQSFPVPIHNHDGAGISLGEMDDDEWVMFLEIFENLLPDAFEARKNMGLSKQRLGSSCEF